MCGATAGVILVVVVVANGAKTTSEYLQKGEEERKGEREDRDRGAASYPGNIRIRLRAA